MGVRKTATQREDARLRKLVSGDQPARRRFQPTGRGAVVRQKPSWRSTGADENDKKRLAAKTVNFSCTIAIRVFLIGAVGYFFWRDLQLTEFPNRLMGLGIIAMVMDLGRVMTKMMTPGTK